MSKDDPQIDAPAVPVKLWLTFPVIAIALVAFAMGQSVFFVVLPSLGRSIALEEVQVGGIISLAAFIIAAVSPWWGRRSDVWGRRSVIVFGLMSYAVTMIAFCVAAVMGMNGGLTAGVTFLTMLGIRAVYALLTAGIQPAATAYVAEATSDEHRTAGLAMVSASIGLGTVLGPVFGNILIDYFGLIGPLVGVALIASAVGIAVQAFLPKHMVRTSMSATARIHFFDKRVCPYLFLMLGVMTVGTGAQTTAGFYFMDLLQVSEREAAGYVAQVLAAAALSLLVAQGLLVQLIKLTPAVMVRGGLLLSAIGFSLVVYPWVLEHLIHGTEISADGKFYWIQGGFILVGLALGIFNPGLMAALSLNVSTDEQGGVAGLLSSAMAGGFVVGPVGAAWIYDVFGQAVPFIVGCALLIVLFFASLQVRFKGLGRA